MHIKERIFKEFASWLNFIKNQYNLKGFYLKLAVKTTLIWFVDLKNKKWRNSAQD